MYHPNIHGIIIGINQYQDNNIDNLKFARSDAELVYQIFTDSQFLGIPPANTVLLLDDEATQKNIHEILRNKLQQHTEEIDTVYIFFAGYGSFAVDSEIKNSDPKTNKYLLSTDTELDNLDKSGIALEDIGEIFSQKNVKQVIFFIDSCFNGKSEGRTVANKLYPDGITFTKNSLEKLSARGSLIISACNINEVALEVSAIGQGLFTHFLVEGIRGMANTDPKGRVTIDEMYRYIYINVLHTAKRLNGNMHPFCKGTFLTPVYLSTHEMQAQDSPEQWRAYVDKLYTQAFHG